MRGGQENLAEKTWRAVGSCPMPLGPRESDSKAEETCLVSWLGTDLSSIAGFSGGEGRLSCPGGTAGRVSIKSLSGEKLDLSALVPI